MKPITLLSLTVAAIALSLAVRQWTPKPEPIADVWLLDGELRATNNLSGGATTGASVEAGGQRPLQRLTKPPVLTRSISRSNAEPVVPAAQSLSESNRIVGELVVAGFSPEDAAEAYRLMNEMASQARNTRPPMPGTRTAIDTNRWPLFEEDEP